MNHRVRILRIRMERSFMRRTALEIAAEQMRLYTQKTSEEQRSIEELEEQTLYALAIHYIQLMVCMKLPLDISSSANLRHSIYNHGSHITSGDADSVTSDFYHSSNDPFKFVHSLEIDFHTLINLF